MDVTSYNLNDNWIQEYHDKHGTFPVITVTLESISIVPRDVIDESANHSKKNPYTNEMWDNLKKSIKKKGLKEMVGVYEEIKNGLRHYTIKEGHHRTCILNELYGPTHKIKVRVMERRVYTTENRIKLKTINNINLHRESTPQLTKKVQDNLQKQIERKLADIKSKSVNNKDKYNFSKVNKTYKDYL